MKQRYDLGNGMVAARDGDAGGGGVRDAQRLFLSSFSLAYEMCDRGEGLGLGGNDGEVRWLSPSFSINLSLLFLLVCGRECS